MRPVQIPATAAGGGIGCGLREFAAEQQTGEAQGDADFPGEPVSGLHYSLPETIGIVLRHRLRRLTGGS